MLVKAYKQLPIEIEGGKGCFVYDSNGKQYLDMYAGHAVASTGHSNPRVVAAIKSQAEKIIFYSTSVGMKIRSEAAAAILAQCPLSSVFFVNSGTEANEAALRLAVAKTGRKKILAMKNSFHGRTLLSLNCTGIDKYKSLAPFQLENVSFAEFGNARDVAAKIDRDTAAVIFEPVQSMGGAIVANDEFYVQVRKTTAENGTMLIYDEVQTAPARTGTMYFAGNYGVVPDMITLAKGIASGLPAGTLVVSQALADKIEYGELGSTFGGGPVVCAAIKATFETIVIDKLLENVCRSSKILFSELVKIKGVKQVRGKGLLIGVVTEKPAADMQTRLLNDGVIIGTAHDANTIRLLPPLTINSGEVDVFLTKFSAAMKNGS